MQGLSESIDVPGKGTVQWIVDLDNGKLKTIETQVYYIPHGTQHLLSPQDYFQQKTQGHDVVESDHIQLHWTSGDVLTIPSDPVNNLLIVKAMNRKEQKQ